MKVGNEYLAIRPAHSFLDISGQKVEFEEEQIKIKVLDKPEHNSLRWVCRVSATTP